VTPAAFVFPLPEWLAPARPPASTEKLASRYHYPERHDDVTLTIAPTIERPTRRSVAALDACVPVQRGLSSERR
jgi:hypothetical protein